MMRGVNFLRSKGFTLVELLVTIALVGILAGVAVPSLTKFLARGEMNGVVNDFSGAIQTARMTAVSRNQCISVCRRASANMACSQDDGPWTNGWIVYANPTCSGDAEVSPKADQIISAHGPVSSALVLNATNGDAPSVIVFTSRGIPLKLDMATSMAFTDQRGEQGADERVMALSATGRLRPTVRQPKSDDPVVAEGQ